MDERQETPRSTAELAYGRQTDEHPAGDETRTDGRSGGDTPLVPEAASATYREKWQAIQTKFVDEPRESVREADGLVAEVIQELARGFADQCADLENQWARGSEVSTEELRRALQQYRSFFHRLLAA